MAKITKKINTRRDHAAIKKFKQRRRGLLKKANELSTLCGASVSLIIHDAVDNEQWHYESEPDVPIILDVENAHKIGPDDFLTHKEWRLSRGGTTVQISDTHEIPNGRQAKLKSKLIFNGGEFEQDFIPWQTDSVPINFSLPIVTEWTGNEGVTKNDDWDVSNFLFEMPTNPDFSFNEENAATSQGESCVDGESNASDTSSDIYDRKLS